MILMKAKKQNKLEMYRSALLEILQGKDELKKGKAYPVGTIREWQGKKFKKLPNGKWMRYYQEEWGRGVDQAMRNTIKKIKNASSIEELAEIVRNNKERFQDADGKMSSIVATLLYEARGTTTGSESRQKSKEHRATLARNVKVQKDISWIVGDPVTVEHFLSSARKAIDDEKGRLYDQDALNLFNAYLSKNGLGDLDTVLGFYRDGDRDKIREYEETIDKRGYTTMGENLKQTVRRYQDAVIKAHILSDPEYNGKLSTPYIYHGNLGLRVYFGTNIGSLPALTVSYDQLEAFAETYISGGSESDEWKREMRALKKSEEYKEWQTTNDPEIVSAISNLKKVTSGVFATDTYARKRSTQLKPAYVKKLVAVFTELQKGFDLSKFTPKDGKKLTIKLTGTSGGAAGFYTEGDTSINISPSMPGTISHEVGHYLWFRGGQELQDDFMKWAKDSGLMDRISTVSSTSKFTDAEKQAYVTGVFNSEMKDIVDKLRKSALGSASLIDGMTDIMNLTRQKLEKNFGSVNKANMPYQRLLYMRPGDIIAMVEQAKANGHWPGQDPSTIVTNLTALRDFSSKDIMKRLLGAVVDKANAGPAVTKDTDISMVRYFQKNKHYFEKPTEVFARTFRNYCAMKSGRQIYRSSGEQDRVRSALGSKRTNVKTDAHGWGFPEVDPPKTMLEFNDGELGKLLKKYLGAEVIKAMTNLVDLEKRMRLFIKARPYPEGTVRSWSGKKFTKKDGHWEPVGADTSRNNARDRKGDNKPQRREGDKGKEETRTIQGSKEMFTELKKLENAGRVFLDDLTGTRKKIYNMLTKEGLVKWSDVGNGEYKAVITVPGMKALDGGHATKAQKKRKKAK